MSPRPQDFVIPEKEEYPITIKSELVYVDDKYYLKEKQFPEDQLFTFSDTDLTTSLIYRRLEDYNQLTITVIKTFQIGRRAFVAFEEEFSKEKSTININQPQNNKIRAFVEKYYAEWLLPSQILNNLSWVYKLRISSPKEQISWSLDGAKFHSFFDMSIMGVEVMNREFITSEKLERIISWKTTEPTAFALFREAEIIIHDNPYSGFILLVASLEIATKAALNGYREEFDNIFENQKLGPIEDLLIYDLFADKYGRNLSDTAIQGIRHLFSERNKVAHQGQFTSYSKGINKPIHPQTFILYNIGGLQKLVRDLLYSIAQFEGNDWVKFGYHIRTRIFEE